MEWWLTLSIAMVLVLMLLLTLLRLREAWQPVRRTAAARPAPWLEHGGTGFETGDLAELEHLIATELNGERFDSPSTESSVLSQALGPVYVALRAEGKLVGAAWAQGLTARDGLVDALRL